MTSPRCPICQRSALEPSSRPFCSERCRTIDLARWLDGAYRIPVDDDPDFLARSEGEPDP
ncbi:MAG: DNA gyrase inhibitor YacG [Deltaproteobacteria bacterium]|nr:DNA gyrase inhibitor YacG [Deltaproteobacteria bacterium]